jgi:hypothetical protein
VKGDKRYGARDAGLRLVTALRDFYNQEVPIILTTGYHLSEEDLELLRRKKASVLRKPLGVNDDLEKLAAHLLAEFSKEEHPGSDTGTVTRYANVSFAEGTEEPLIVGQVYSLYVQILPSKPASAYATAGLQLAPEREVTLLVHVYAESINVTPGDGRHLVVGQDGRSASVEFLLAPESSNERQTMRTIHVCFYHQASFVRRISFEVEVALPSDAPLPRPDPSYGGYVHVKPRTGPVVFTLYLPDPSTKSGGFLVTDKAYPNVVGIMSADEWEDLNQSLRSAISNIAYDSCKRVNAQQRPLSKEETFEYSRSLLSAGERAFYKVFPSAKTRQAICGMIDDAVLLASEADQVPVVEVVADYYLIPWDAVLFSAGEGNEEHQLSTVDNLWGLKCIVHKKCHDYGDDVRPTGSLIESSEALQIGLAWNTEFEAVQEFEIEYLKSLGTRLSLALLDNPESVDKVLKLFRRELAVLQLACHARIQRPVAHSYFKFSEEAVLRLEQLDTPRYQLGGAPLVFLSSCESLSFDARQHNSFLQTFVDKGCRGVLGAETKVNAPFASRFLTKVYQRFFAGEAIGRSLWTVRRQCWNNLSCRTLMGMAFAYYGDIEVRLKHRVGDDAVSLDCNRTECCL